MNDLIVDGNSLYARCWYAVNGEPRAVLRTCVVAVLQLLDQREDGRLGVPITRTMFAWDGKAKTDKHRKEKPPGYIDTRYKFQEILLTLFNTVHGYHPDYEADDVVATAAFNSKARNVYVVSGDKDLMQLQGGNVSYYCLNSKHIVPARTICQKFSVKRPSQVALAMAITGDSGDGIAGVPRWGPKKVQKIFEWVTEQMTFQEALHVVTREIPKDLLPFFLESLDKTLLHTEVPDIPDPMALEFCSSAELQALKLDGVYPHFERVARQYGDRKSSLTDMIRGSESE